ncbi:hypothetical protein ES707_02263 [subsurface metagenome]
MTLMNSCIRWNLNSIGNYKFARWVYYFTSIAYLATHFSIKRGRIQNDACLLPLLHGVYSLTVNKNRSNHRPMAYFVMAHKLGNDRTFSCKSAFALSFGCAVNKLLRGSRPLPLLLHFFLKAF